MKDFAGKIIGNTLWLFVQRIGGRLLTFILMICLARGLGSLGFGKLNFVNSFVLLFVALSDLGITTLAIREVARHKERGPEHIGSSATLKLFLSIVVYIGIVISISIMNIPSDTRVAAYLIGAGFIFRNIGAFFGAVFQAYEDMKYITFSEILEKCFLLFACLLLLHKGYGLISISLMYLFSGVFHCLLNVIFVHGKFLKPRYRIDIKFWRENLKEAFPLAVVTVISIIYYNIDIVMLGKMKGEVTAGCYGVSYHLFFAIATITGAFLSATFPVMSRFFEESEPLLKKIYQKSFKLMIGLGIPISIGGFLLAEKIILFLFGSQYQHSIATFKIFSFLIVFSYLNGLAGYFLTSINRQTLTAKFLAITTFINVTLNFILIPHYSDIGAACATAVSEVLFFIFFFLSLHDEFRYLPVREIAKSVISSAIMGAIVVLMIRGDFSLVPIILVGAIVYSISAWVTGYISTGEKAKLYSIFWGRKTK